MVSDVPATDEHAARALASAYGEAQPSEIQGEPAREVTGEFSLDTVFKGEEPAPVPEGALPEATLLRFDQFFAHPEGEETAASPAPPTSESPDTLSNEVAQFAEWLKGLKRP